MSIPSQQIGWSQKAKLLWQISKQLEQLTGIVSDLVTYSTTTTTSTTTVAPVHYNRSSTGLLIDNSCGNWQTNINPVNSVAFVGGSDICTATSFTTSSVISNGNYWISDGSYSRRFNASGGVFTFTAACAPCA